MSSAPDWGRRIAPPESGSGPGPGPARGPVPVVEYGPDMATEADLRLLGNVESRRVLDLGCGTGQNAVALARQGAHVIGLEPVADLARAARDSCAAAGVKAEIHRGDLADLAFIRADSVDVALSCFALGQVSDLSRVFRQVHRVLRRSAAFVISLTHPAYALVDPDHPSEPLTVRRSYFDRQAAAEWSSGDAGTFRHTVGDLFTGLTRNNFRVDVVLEPECASDGARSPWWREAALWLPRTLVIRARKEGL